MTTSCPHSTDKDVFFSERKTDARLPGIRYYGEPEVCLALVDISRVQAMHERDARLLRIWLSEKERDYIRKFRFPKRYYEWLCGRIAGKAALLYHADLLQKQWKPDVITILADDYGRPRFMRPHDICKRQLSISHSNCYAVSMTARKSCGVDIQQIESRICALGDRFASEREIHMARQVLSGSLKEGLTLIWAVKEALKKNCLYDRPGLFEAIRIERIHPETMQGWTLYCRVTNDNRLRSVRAVCINEYMLAWCEG